MRKLILLTFLGLAGLAAAHPFVGPGLNTSSKMLPIDKLRSIGVRWVRCDAVLSEEETRQVVRHYRNAGMPQLWILVQWDKNPESTMRMLWRSGVRDVEIYNEPEQSVQHASISPEAYAGDFRRLSKV